MALHQHGFHRTASRVRMLLENISTIDRPTLNLPDLRTCPNHENSEESFHGVPRLSRPRKRDRRTGPWFRWRRRSKPSPLSIINKSPRTWFQIPLMRGQVVSSAPGIRFIRHPSLTESSPQTPVDSTPVSTPISLPSSSSPQDPKPVSVAFVKAAAFRTLTRHGAHPQILHIWPSDHSAYLLGAKVDADIATPDKAHETNSIPFVPRSLQNITSFSTFLARRKPMHFQIITPSTTTISSSKRVSNLPSDCRDFWGGG
jgi:hypothetical protein